MKTKEEILFMQTFVHLEMATDPNYTLQGDKNY